MKKLNLFLLIILVILALTVLISCSEMEREQMEKERIAEKEGLWRRITVYKPGISDPVFEEKMKSNIETGSNGILTITENDDGKMKIHKLIIGEEDTVIIEEID